MINAKIIADSVYLNCRVTTFELEYPRYIHSELMTHRMFSRNAASSRAIPVDSLIEMVEEDTVMPMWTAHAKGMQGPRITSGTHAHRLNEIWLYGMKCAVAVAKALRKEGAHKQQINRVLEPYQHIKTIVTATTFDNWFTLRDHPDAAPEIQALAREMRLELLKHTPEQLKEGEWHLPYVTVARTDEGMRVYEEGTLDLETAKRISASCCAQVSYRKQDTSVAKADAIYERLVTSTPLHASPFEHVCRASVKESYGNFWGWIQLRKDIEDGHRTALQV